MKDAREDLLAGIVYRYPNLWRTSRCRRDHFFQFRRGKRGQIWPEQA